MGEILDDLKTNKKKDRLPPRKDGGGIFPRAGDQEGESGDSILFSEKLKKHFEPDVVKMIKSVTYYISRAGISFEEACVLAQHKPDEVKLLLKQHKMLNEFFEYKMLEFKKDLLIPITDRARAGDDKTAMWLLEKKFPEEFNNKGKGAQDTGEGFLRELFKKSEDVFDPKNA